MNRNPPRRAKKWSGRLALGLGLFLLLLALLAAVFDYSLRPIVSDMAVHSAKVVAVRSINDAMAEVLAEEGVSYEDIVAVNKTEQGSVSSIQSNMLLVNRLKLQAADKIIERITATDNQVLTIPVGNLTGLQLLSGRGPALQVKILPVGYVQTRLHNQFNSAGINQTLHQIMLETSLEMLVVLPGFTIRTETATDYCIAETVIVGAVPEGYAGINLGDSPTVAGILEAESAQFTR